MMKTFRILAVVIVCLGIAFALRKASTAGLAAKAPDPARILSQSPTPAATPVISPVVPVDVNNSSNPSQNDWYTLGWQTFVALDWPALAGGNLGQPNTNLSVGATASGAFIPTVWATYRDVKQFLGAVATPLLKEKRLS